MAIFAGGKLRLVTRAMLCFLSFSMIFLGVEAVVRAYDRWVRGWAGELEWTPNAYDRNNQSPCKFMDSLTPDPFLGFVYSVGRACSDPRAHWPGFIGPPFPARKTNSRFVLLFSGGSVADLCSRPSIGTDHAMLQDILNEKFYPPQGQSFLVLNGAVGGWKEPQPRFLFELYSHVVDGFVTLEGYNEFRMLRNGLPLNSPTREFMQLNPLYFENLQVLERTLILDWLHRNLTANSLWRHSHAAYAFFSGLKNHWLDGPLADGGNQEVIHPLDFDWDEQIQLYLEHLRAIHQLSKSENKRDAFFIQPVPALFKRLNLDEKRVVGDLSYGPLYLKMTHQLEEASSSGLPLTSLLRSFEKLDDRLYRDDIHYFDQGCRVVLQDIATDLGKLWNLRERN